MEVPERGSPETMMTDREVTDLCAIRAKTIWLVAFFCPRLRRQRPHTERMNLVAHPIL